MIQLEKIQPETAAEFWKTTKHHMPFQKNVITRPTRKGHGLTQNMSRLTVDGWKQLEQSKNFPLHDPSKHHKDNPGSW